MNVNRQGREIRINGRSVVRLQLFRIALFATSTVAQIGTLRRAGRNEFFPAGSSVLQQAAAGQGT